MKIAQIAPLFESVPPKLYGGTERIVHYLTEELVSMGHDVTLYASGDSVTSAQLIPQCKTALRLNKDCMDDVAHHVLMVENLYKDAHKYDVIHSHIDYLPYPTFRRIKTPSVATLHGRLDIPDLVPLYNEFSDIPAISISDAQQKPLSWINWQRTIYHGIPISSYVPYTQHGKYLAFLGRISPEKRLDDAIAIATTAGMPLKIAAKISKADEPYFDAVIKPLLNNPLVEFIGEIGEKDKNEFLGNAYALIFPVDWPEPFGLVMIEAMACGTPVIARARGSIPEVIESGVTGFIADSVEEAARAIKKVETISRKKCREVFEQRFTAKRMAEDYVSVYKNLIARQRPMGAVYDRSYSDER